jgi:hypothetical protein
MNGADVWTLGRGLLQGVGASTIFILVLFIGFCVVLGFPKLRPTTRKSLVVRSLDEVVGTPVAYLPPDAPRGPADQLHSPELLEAAARK